MLFDPKQIDWETGTRDERLRLLTYLREADPAKARFTVTATVAGEVDSGGLVVEATMPADAEHEFSATAKSGASGDNVSIAVSFALTIANLSTIAQLRMVHVLNGHEVRSYADHFIRQA